MYIHGSRFTCFLLMENIFYFHDERNRSDDTMPSKDKTGAN